MQPYTQYSQQQYPYYSHPAHNGAQQHSTAPPGAPGTYPMRRPQHSRAIPPSSTAQYAIAASNANEPTQDTSRHSRHHRGHSASAAVPPLKSAMKKSAWSTVPAPQDGVRRSRTLPGNEHSSRHDRDRSSTTPFIPDQQLMRTRTTSDPAKARANSSSRPRSRSQIYRYYTPDHLILSFHGTNKIKFSSLIYQVTVETIQERVLPIWPAGHVYQVYKNDLNEYTIEFAGDPWSAQGSHANFAYSLILMLFSVLAQQGYHCITTINPGLSMRPPRLVFSLGSSDTATSFFLIAFSSSRRKMKLLNCQSDLCQNLTEILREAFPRRLTIAKWDEEDVYTIEFSRVGFKSIHDLIVSEILQYTHTYGYKLDASVPFIKSGLFGLIQGRREVWIFRRLYQRRKNSGA